MTNLTEPKEPTTPTPQQLAANDRYGHLAQQVLGKLAALSLAIQAAQENPEPTHWGQVGALQDVSDTLDGLLIQVELL